MGEPPHDSDEQLPFRLGPTPRAGYGADEPGAYALVARASRHELAPGESVELHFQITGYGRIDAAKIFFSPPLRFVDPEKSSIRHDLGFDPENPSQILVGVTQSPLSSGALFIGLTSTGIDAGWGRSTMFFDMPSSGAGVADSTPMIMTETQPPRAPLTVELHTLPDVGSGNYSVEAYLTYFDGFSWSSSSTATALRVTSWWERQQVWTWLIGLVVTVVGIAVSIVLALAVDSVVSGQPEGDVNEPQPPQSSADSSPTTAP